MPRLETASTIRIASVPRVTCGVAAHVVEHAGRRLAVLRRARPCTPGSPRSASAMRAAGTVSPKRRRQLDDVQAVRARDLEPALAELARR